MNSKKRPNESDNERKRAEDELELSRQFTELILHLANDFVNVPLENLEKKIQESIGMIGKFVKSDRVYIFDYDFPKNLMNNIYEWCADEISPEIENLQNIPNNLFPEWVSAHLKGEIINIPDISDLPENSNLRKLLESQSIKTLITIPIFIGNQCNGFVGFDAVNAIKVWSDSEILLLKTFATLLGNLFDRKNKETDLKESEEKYRAITDQTLDIIFIIDKTGKQLFFNESVERLLGYKAEELIGKSFTKFVPGKELPEYFKQIKKVFQNKFVFSFETKIYHKDGHPVDVEINGRLIKQKGKHVAQGSIRDISARKRTEEALHESKETFRHLFEESADPILLLKDTGFADCNQSTVDLLGYASKDEFLNKQPWELSPERQPDGMLSSGKAALMIARALKEGYNRFEWIHTKSGGTDFPVEVMLTPFTLKGEQLFYTIWRDITERKRSEQELISSFSLLNASLESTADGILIADGKGGIVKWNQKFAEMWGIPEVILKTHDDNAAINHVLDKLSDPDQFISLVKNLYANPEKSSFDRLEFKDGRVFERYSQPQKLDNAIVGRVWSFRDVTERVKNQMELVRLSRAVEQSPVSIVITDIKGNIDYVNPKLCEITGYSKDELIGENPRIMSSGERTKEEYKVFWETILSGKDWHGEFHNKKKNGELYCESASVSPIKNEKDEITHLIGIKEDITERKRSEQIQKALFAISGAVVTTSSLAELIEIIQQQIGTIIDTKNFFIAFYDESTGMLSTPFVHDEKDDITSWPAEKSLTGHVIRNKKSVLLSKEDILEMNRSGKIDLIGTTAESWLGVPLLIGEKVNGAFVVQNYENRFAYSLKDLEMVEFVASQISQSIRRQNAIIELKDALVKADAGDKLKTTFLNNISHEVRTPLNGILGFAELISQPGLSESEKIGSLSMLHESSERLLNTINNYMEISLLTSGNMTVYKKEFSPVIILKSISEHYKLVCSNKKLELLLETPPDPDNLIINSDPEIFRKIISHLLNNALKFTEKGSINFGYGIHRGYLEFFVKDTGRGIGKESIDVVFDHFTKEDQWPMKITEGSGLGLSISKGMAELLGGNLRVESEKGKGSSFFFSIPISIDIQQEIAVNKEVRPETGKGPKAILVAEDDETNFFYFHALLRQYTSSEVIHALNGKEAVELFRKNPDIGLILMDIKMPVMNGLKATREIKLINKEVPIIAITAHAMLGDEEKVLAAGCDGYLSKPISGKILLDKISEFIKT